MVFLLGSPFLLHLMVDLAQNELNNLDGQSSKVLSYYANTPMQYTAIFHGCKNVHFQMKFLIFFLFLLKTLIVGTR